jgi:hypothetical protein
MKARSNGPQAMLTQKGSGQRGERLAFNIATSAKETTSWLGFTLTKKTLITVIKNHKLIHVSDKKTKNCNPTMVVQL